MLPRETGKQRSQRIEMDYYRQRGGLAKSKVVLAAIALVFGLGAVAYSYFRGDVANPGPLAKGHASFEKDCSKCHQTLTPIGSDSVRNFALLGVNEQKSVEHTRAVCTSCHYGAGHPIGDHYQAMMNDQWDLLDKNCALCHADHKGRDFDLTQVANQKCVQCHDKLKQVCTEKPQTVQLAGDNASIDSFSAAGHGDFASLGKEDPGQVIFDHAQHMLPGQSSKGKDVIVLGDLEPELRERYRQKMQQLKSTDPENFGDLDTSNSGKVQLDCSSCHQMASSRGDVTTNSQLELGRSMKPIVFEEHCQACHSMNPAGRSEGTLPIPHAATWRELDQWIQAKIVGMRTDAPRANPLGIGAVSPEVPTCDMTEREQLLQQWTDAAEIDKAREILKKQCLKCHQESHIDSDQAIMAAKNPSNPPLIPDHFLAHGIYDHGAHLTVDCKYCHQQAYEAGTPEATGTDQNKVMIGGIETCVSCHRPADSKTPARLAEFGTQSLWASDSCTMCHRYHTSDQLHSLASLAPAVQRTPATASAAAETAATETAGSESAGSETDSSEATAVDPGATP